MGENEFDLALSRLEADTRNIGRTLNEIVAAFRSETLKGPNLRHEAEWKQAYKHSDELALRELLRSSSTLANLDAKQAAARAAQAEADEISVELNKTWLEWNAIPGQAEKLGARLARIAGERALLKGADYDVAIKALYLHKIDPQAGVMMSGGLTEVLAEKQLREIKLTILNELEVKLTGELKELRAKDKQLSKSLGKPVHNF